MNLYLPGQNRIYLANYTTRQFVAPQGLEPCLLLSKRSVINPYTMEQLVMEIGFEPISRSSKLPCPAVRRFHNFSRNAQNRTEIKGAKNPCNNHYTTFQYKNKKPVNFEIDGF